MIVHLEIASLALHKDSEEAKIQMQKEDGTFGGRHIMNNIFYT